MLCHKSLAERKETFLNKARDLHNNKYSYSKVNYINLSSKVEIICPIHGSFYQTPKDHIHLKHGCPRCGKTGKLAVQDVLDQFRSIHGDRYDYSAVSYVNDSTKVEIICSVHGSFYQTPNDHKNGHGCPMCARNMSDQTNIIKCFRKVHGDKYDYSKFKYKGNSFKSIIICPIHGEFLQNPCSHLDGHGCPKCIGRYRTTDEIITLFRKVHGDKYDYSKVNYKGVGSKVEIICRTHGSFYQTPSSHLCLHGCPRCRESKGESLIRSYLDNCNISYETQKRFKDCKDKRPLPFDFYLPDYNMCIEYDGVQHFIPVGAFGSFENHQLLLFHDTLKTEYCKNHNIVLLRISYKDYCRIDNILKDFLSKVETKCKLDEKF